MDKSKHWWTVFLNFVLYIDYVWRWHFFKCGLKNYGFELFLGGTIGLEGLPSHFVLYFDMAFPRTIALVWCANEPLWCEVVVLSHLTSKESLGLRLYHTSEILTYLIKWLWVWLLYSRFFHSTNTERSCYPKKYRNI